jgi:hypothetical protein
MRDVCIVMSMKLFKTKLNLHRRACPILAYTRAFYNSKRRTVTLRPNAQQVAIGWIKPYTVGH